MGFSPTYCNENHTEENSFNLNLSFDHQSNSRISQKKKTPKTLSYINLRYNYETVHIRRNFHANRSRTKTMNSNATLLGNLQSSDFGEGSSKAWGTEARARVMSAWGFYDWQREVVIPKIWHVVGGTPGTWRIRRGPVWGEHVIKIVGMGWASPVQ